MMYLLIWYTFLYIYLQGPKGEAGRVISLPGPPGARGFPGPAGNPGLQGILLSYNVERVLNCSMILFHQNKTWLILYLTP